MPDSLALTCPEHEAALIPSTVQPGMLMCPDATCATVVCLSGTAPASPLTYLEQGAAERHEWSAPTRWPGSPAPRPCRSCAPPSRRRS